MNWAAYNRSLLTPGEIHPAWVEHPFESRMNALLKIPESFGPLQGSETADENGDTANTM